MFNHLGAALAGGLGHGGYGLYHPHHYGHFGFGNPYHHGYGLGGYGAPYGYGYQGFGMRRFLGAALGGKVGLGLYGLSHLYRYGQYGLGYPYRRHFGLGGYGFGHYPYRHIF
ncbi:unnamed protein product [Rotaria sp. Silwood1]|nr:unnamed protein product [Rotaria sp. Silwood1]CAF1268909.1 unnamed protein product [Rotaria sp. Silwood1]CAF3568243.1 unnamed protein product [Rotaria sp. Silwood1]